MIASKFCSRMMKVSNWPTSGYPQGAPLPYTTRVAYGRGAPCGYPEVGQLDTFIMREQNFDAIIIGAGLGGLLSAAQLLQRGKRIVVLERLPHCGGRFTAKTFQGTQVSTGAVHMIPFGSSGVLAHMLRRLQVPHHFFDADVFASFHVHGRQIRSRGLLGLFKVFGPRQFFWFIRVG